MFRIGFLFLVVILTGSLHLSGQLNPNNNRSGFPPKGGIDSLQTQKTGPDTTIYKVYTIYDINNKSDFSDTLLHDFHKYDPIRKNDKDGVHLGNLGSSSRSLSYSPISSHGFRIGLDQFAEYQLTKEEFQFFELNRPFSNLFFSPGGGQESFIVKSQFSRNFADSVSLSLDYQRITQGGIYNSQKTKSTYLGIGISKIKQRHQMFLLGVVNANNEQHNGGVTDLTLFADPNFNFRGRIPTHLADANTRMANFDLSVTNYFQFTDSTFQKEKFRLMHSLAWSGGSYKFYDEDMNESAINYYDHLLVDKRGMRYQLHYNELSNSIYFLSQLNKMEFKIGVVHKLHKIDREIEKLTRQDLFIHANGKLNFLKSLLINVDTKIGLANDLGEFQIIASLENQIKSGIKFKTGLQLFRQAPSLLEQKAQVSQVDIWNNEFDLMQGSVISGSIRIDRINLEFNGALSVLLNPIYFSDQVTPLQAKETFSALQGELKQHFKLWKFNIENRITYQRFSQNLYQLPDFLTEHEVYLEGIIFKRMLTRLGLNTRFVHSYYSAAFSPVFGTFYQQSSDKQDHVYLTDLYTSFRISDFRAFIRLENMNHLIINDVSMFYNSYPQFDFNVRLGVSWILKD